MRISVAAIYLLLSFVPAPVAYSSAVPSATVQEQSLSRILDLWRDGRFEQLYEHLAGRGRVSREQFLVLMNSATIRPACCFQKIRDFMLLDEKKSTSAVYARIGLEGAPNQAVQVSREFRLKKRGGEWLMPMNDILDIAGVRVKRYKRFYYKNR